MQGKIIKGIAGFYYVQAEDQKTYACRAKGIFRNQNIKPLVGDLVSFDVTDPEALEGNVSEILPRKNELIRPAVSNIDQALVVFAVKDPEPNYNLLDRFLFMMAYSGIPVIICFNKIDLSGEKRLTHLREVYALSGYELHFISTVSGLGIEELRHTLKGRTTVLAGPSGVGKSSLLNLLYPEAGMETGAISEKIRRGKHTTRHSEFFRLDEDTYLFDTPGFSSIYLPECEPETIKDYFPEFSPYEADCRFIGCVHIGEKDCGIKTSVTKGLIPKSRYLNYRLFYEEQKEKRRYS